MNRTSVRMLVRRGSIRSLAEGSYEPALAMFVRYAELTFPAPGRCRGSIVIPGLGGTPSLPTRAGAGSRPSSDATLSTGRRWRSRISRSAALRRTPGRQPGPPPDPRAGRQRPLRQPGRPHGPHGAGTIRSQDDYEHTKRRPSARGPRSPATAKRVVRDVPFYPRSPVRNSLNFGSIVACQRRLRRSWKACQRHGTFGCSPRGAGA